MEVEPVLHSAFFISPLPFLSGSCAGKHVCGDKRILERKGITRGFRRLKNHASRIHGGFLEIGQRDADVEILPCKNDTPVRERTMRALAHIPLVPMAGKRHVAWPPNGSPQSIKPSCAETDIQSTLFMEEGLLAGINWVQSRFLCRAGVNQRHAAIGKPFLVPNPVLLDTAANSQLHDNHGNEQPKEGKGDRDQAKRVHEPRLVEVVQVLIDEPEHPAEEHKGDQFSQCVGHGC